MTTIWATFRSVAYLALQPLRSFVGMHKNRMLSSGQQPVEWIKEITNARVLIVGTGPSIDIVNEQYFSKFDIIVCINHAIFLDLPDAKIYYFSTDPFQTRQVFMELDRKGESNKITPERTILLPNYFSSYNYFKPDMLNKITLLHPSECKLQIVPVAVWRFGRIKFPLFAPAEPREESLFDWLDRPASLGDYAYFHHTSALSAVAFVAKHRPKEVRLIGCDFSEGRASKFRDSAGGTAYNFNPAKRGLLKIQKVLKKKGIEVTNDSWQKL